MSREKWKSRNPVGALKPTACRPSQGRFTQPPPTQERRPVVAKNIAKEAANGTSGEGATAKHNSKVREERFQDAMQRTFALDQQIEALIEEHIKPLREDKREIKSKLSEDFNVTATTFNARYAPYKFEAKARANGDEASIDLLREIFEATPVGGQMDFVNALKPEGSAATH
ncbi:hypothetical protein HBA54_27275 [Pelagibius litoralis]|uniref:Uncharacterized protein n=1 Tax=Pelagibius litoralis TaxID=374515 RepID=A0A967KDK0_9PROT|nr:hypothetical protein [Pelagibius litoralis]NIA72297.1 hypothetical protein [Pelagibius litoralis]